MTPGPFGVGASARLTCARPPICEIARTRMAPVMNRRRNFVMMALAALVAGAAVLVYVHNEASNALAGRVAETTTVAAGAADQAPQVLHDFNSLPDPVKRMLERMAAAAQSGEIETMRPVLESNEMKPMVAAAHVDDP